MKKIIAAVAGIVMAVSLVGCKITPEQAKVVAQQAGVFSAVGWIAMDNPSTDAVVVVSGIVDVIKEKSKSIEAGKTYTEVVYPEIVKVIDTKVAPQYRPLAKAGTLSFLGSVDMLFALHPEWKADQDVALGIVNAFMDGVKAGLGLRADSAAIIQARKTATARAMVMAEGRRSQFEEFKKRGTLKPASKK